VFIFNFFFFQKCDVYRHRPNKEYFFFASAILVFFLIILIHFQVKWFTLFLPPCHVQLVIRPTRNEKNLVLTRPRIVFRLFIDIRLLYPFFGIERELILAIKFIEKARFYLS
jgi:hypothetical protein